LQGWLLNIIILVSGNPARWTLTCGKFSHAMPRYISKILYPFQVCETLIYVGVAVLAMFTS
jgi:hypothetical protein